MTPDVLDPIPAIVVGFLLWVTFIIMVLRDNKRDK